MYVDGRFESLNLNCVTKVAKYRLIHYFTTLEWRLKIFPDFSHFKKRKDEKNFELIQCVRGFRSLVEMESTYWGIVKLFNTQNKLMDVHQSGLITFSFRK